MRDDRPMYSTLARFFLRFRALWRAGEAKNEIPKVLAFTVVLVLASGSAFYFAEREAQEDLTIWDGFWWAIVTTTTVGYGDYSAVTPIGRFVVAYPLMMVGIGAIGYLVGLVATVILEYSTRKKRGLMNITETGHVIVCGYPGKDRMLQILRELRILPDYKERAFVLVTDQLTEMPDEIAKAGVRFVQGNPAREDTLRRANLSEAAGVFILASDPGDPVSDERSFAVGAVVETVSRADGRDLRTVVELVSRENARFMRKSGVDSMVSVDGVNSCLLVQEFLNQGVGDVFAQLLTNTVGSQFYIVDTRLAGYRVRDIQHAALDHETDLQFIGLIHGQDKTLNPKSSRIIEPGDRVIVLAESAEAFKSVEDYVLRNRPREA